MDSQLSLVVHSCSLPQRLLPATRTSSSSAVTVYTDAAKTLVLAFCVQPAGLLQCTTAWRIRRAVASRTIRPERRPSTCNWRAARDHITSILRQLHWLPVRRRVQSKVAVLVSQCLSGNAPTHQSDDCQLIRRLRSTDTAIVLFDGSHHNFGNRRFAAAGSRL